MNSSKNWKRVILEDAVVVIIAIAVVWCSSLGLQFYLGTPTPLLAVESGSMEPTLYRGDLVIVRRVEIDTLEIGDIIIFTVEWSDVPVVHRIVQVEVVGGGIQFITKGDNNPTNDPWPVQASDVLAKVIGSIRYLGFITLFLILPGGIYFVVFIVIIFLAVSVLSEGFTSLRKTDS